MYLENNVADNENSTNDLDDLFTVKDDGKDEFAELFSKNDNDKPDLSDESSLALDDLPGSSESIPDLDVSQSTTAIDDDPFKVGSNDTPVGFTDSIIGNLQDGEENSGTPSLNKKGKKAKKEKAPKVKKAKKEPKEKAPKGPIVDKAAGVGVRILFVLLLVGLILANVAAFIIAGVACVTFLIIFDLLGLFALLVPVLMLSALRKKPLSVFDTFLALAAIFAVVACMAILAGQAVSYGSSIKAAMNSNVAESMDA